MLKQHAARPEGCISDLVFDEWRAGELAEPDAQRLHEHLAGCSACRARHAELARAAEDFLARFPEPPVRAPQPMSAAPAPGAAAPRGAAPRVRKLPAWLWGSGFATLAAAAAFALLLRSPTGPPGADLPGASPVEPGETGTRIKGSARIGFAVLRGQTVLPGADGQQVYPGDRLRFFAATSAPLHLAILSLDGGGNVTEYYPGDGLARAVPVSPRSYLESSVELDHVLGKESLWAVFCPRPFEVAPLARALAERRELAPPAGCSLDRLDLDKRAAP